ncbi:MAG TPA: hypothetical protein VFY10_09080 [Dehalococcoidia bacterium]|jgi:hypothetical protein|nr:hypothetical protein [Dehalococcoidia bacterium]
MNTRTRDGARLLLAGIRLINGAIGLFAPQIIMGRFRDEEHADTPVATYALRMFGIRTILSALDLVRGDDDVREHAQQLAPIMHASDLCTAFLIAKSGRVKTKTGLMIVSISALNTLLALISAKNGTDAVETTA